MTELFEPADPEQPNAFGELAVTSERDGATHTIALAGELDISTVQRVELALEEAEAGDARAIVLDLSGLTFMDSTGVRLVLGAHARSRSDDTLPFID